MYYRSRSIASGLDNLVLIASVSSIIDITYERLAAHISLAGFVRLTLEEAFMTMVCTFVMGLLVIGLVVFLTLRLAAALL